MSELSLNAQSLPDTEEGVQVSSRTLVSCVKNATDTATQHYDAKEIIESIRADKLFRLRAPVENIRREFSSVMASTNNDRKAAKGAIDAPKKKLPGVMWSGTFGRRRKDDLLQHSGLLCADLDELGGRHGEVRAKILTSPHLWALFDSPTGDGLKCVFLVAADAEKHHASYLAVRAHVEELTGEHIDESCKDVARLCFLSHDPDAYLNDDALELAPRIETEKPASAVTAPMCESEIKARQSIAAELLGQIDWSTETQGCCTCPGQHLHTTGNGASDCEVRIDGVPTLHCFHNHCRGIVGGVNHELRSRIGKAEWVARSQMQNGSSHRVVNAGAADSASPAIELPAIVSVEQFLNEPQEMPAELVKGMIHQGALTMFAGGSKSFKTFTLLDLGLSVSQGEPWWERDVTPGRVLYLNFEISKPFFQKRLSDLADAKALIRPLENFDVWNLRGHAADIKQLMPKIIERCQGGSYAMIILDPIYKLMNGRNENAAGEMAEFLNPLETLAEETGAAVVYSHHFAKGLASSKEQLDRASGSGVFARHADAIITITPHEEETAFVVEATLRNLPAPKPFVMRWGYPLMQPAPELDPKKLKNKVGAKAKYTVDCILTCLVDGMTTGEWQAAAIKQDGLAASTFAKLKSEAVAEGSVEARGKTWFRIPKILRVNVKTGVTAIRDAAPQDRPKGLPRYLPGEVG